MNNSSVEDSILTLENLALIRYRFLRNDLIYINRLLQGFVPSFISIDPKPLYKSENIVELG